MLRALTADEVSFTLECLPEDIPIEGNASAIDPETDEATERWIHEQLEGGNEWAWCFVVLKARWKGFEGTDSLGCCSYLSEEDFRQPGGYYDDMRQAALDELNHKIARISDELESLRV